MVKISALSLLAATATAANVLGSDVTPANMLSQSMQELPVGEGSGGTCGVPKKTQLRFVNSCHMPVHIWRQDSSVDKATVLPVDGAYGEPIRQDWRSGMTGFRLSQDGMAPYAGRPTGMLSQWMGITPEYAAWNGHTYNVMGADKDNIIVGWGLAMAATCGKTAGDNSDAETTDVAAREVKNLYSNPAEERNFRWNMKLMCPKEYPIMLSVWAQGDVYLCGIPQGMQD